MKIVVYFRLHFLQFKRHFPILALKVLVPLLNYDFSTCRSFQEGLNFTQLLEGRGMLLLELTQFLLEDGVVLLELNMLSAQACKHFREFAEFGFCPLSSHRSVRGLTFHRSRMLAENSELLLHFCHSLLKLGFHFFNFLEPLIRGPCILDFRDLSKVAVYQCTSEEALQLKSTTLDKAII